MITAWVGFENGQTSRLIKYSVSCDAYLSRRREKLCRAAGCETTRLRVESEKRDSETLSTSVRLDGTDREHLLDLPWLFNRMLDLIELRVSLIDAGEQ